MRSGGFDQAFPLSSSHGMPMTNTCPNVSWRRGFGSNNSKSALCATRRRPTPDCRFKEIVAAGDDEQGWKIDVERQTSAVRNFGSAASSPAKKSTPNICSRPIRRFGSYPTVSLRPMVSNDAELYAPHTGAHPRIGCRTACRRQTQPRLPHCFQWPRSVASTRHLRNRR